MDEDTSERGCRSRGSPRHSCTARVAEQLHGVTHCAAKRGHPVSFTSAVSARGDRRLRCRPFGAERLGGDRGVCAFTRSQRQGVLATTPKMGAIGHLRVRSDAFSFLDCSRSCRHRRCISSSNAAARAQVLARHPPPIGADENAITSATSAADGVCATARTARAIRYALPDAIDGKRYVAQFFSANVTQSVSPNVRAGTRASASSKIPGRSPNWVDAIIVIVLEAID